MSIKATIKEHFASNPLKSHFQCNSFKEHWEKGNSSFKNHWDNHWDYFLPNNTKNGILEMEGHEDNTLISFRRFTGEDLDGCAELFKKVFSDDPWYDDWTSLNQARNYLNELICNPVFEGFVVQENSNIVAVCMGRKRSWWMGKEFFIDEFFVENGKQGNGIGTKLMDFTIDNLLEEGYARLVLLTNKEIPAERFYLKNEFYNNQKRTVMVKEL